MWPISEGKDAYSDVDYLETWQGMEECVKLGLAKSIGLSNFNSEQIDRVLQHAKVKPVVNQIEVNPNMNQKKLIQFCKDRDIVVVGYCPLGRSDSTGLPGFPEPTIFDPKVAEIGKKYNKTPAQVVLRYLVIIKRVNNIPIQRKHKCLWNLGTIFVYVFRFLWEYRLFQSLLLNRES